MVLLLAANHDGFCEVARFMHLDQIANNERSYCFPEPTDDVLRRFISSGNAMKTAKVLQRTVTPFLPNGYEDEDEMGQRRRITLNRSFRPARRAAPVNLTEMEADSDAESAEEEAIINKLQWEKNREWVRKRKAKQAREEREKREQEAKERRQRYLDSLDPIQLCNYLQMYRN